MQLSGHISIFSYFIPRLKSNFLDWYLSLAILWGLQKDITDQFHEVVVAIIREEIFGLNGHKSGDESKRGHFCVLLQQLF
jgi:hypothetical protein